VNRSLQYRFLATILIYCFIIAVFIFVFLFVPEFIKLSDKSLSFEVRAATADRVLMLHSRIWPVIISLIILLGIHSILLFHRVVGPLCRFRWAFEQIRKGNLGFRVKLRKKDYLHDEEEALNNMIEALAGKLKDIKTTSLDSMNSLYELEKNASGWTETDREHLRVHREYLSKLVDAVEYF
jgi:methyl-accepting chemotaxis protein